AQQLRVTSWTPAALRSSASRGRSAGRARQGRSKPEPTPAVVSPVRQMCARADGGSPSALVRALPCLDVVVQVELPRVGAEAAGVSLVLALVGEPGVDHVLGEHAALEQELVVGFERGQGVVEGAGDL